MSAGLAPALDAAMRVHARARAVVLVAALAGVALLLSFLAHVAGPDLPPRLSLAIGIGLALVVAGWGRLRRLRRWAPLAALGLWAGLGGWAVFPLLSQTQMQRGLTGMGLALAAGLAVWTVVALWHDRQLRRRLGPALAEVLGLTHEARPRGENPLHPLLDPGAPRFAARDGIAGEAGGRALRAARIRCYRQGRMSETIFEGTLCEIAGWPAGPPLAVLRQGAAIAAAERLGLVRCGTAAGLVLMAPPGADSEATGRLTRLADEVVAVAGPATTGVAAADGRVQVLVAQAADPFALGNPLTDPAVLRGRLAGALAAVELPLRLLKAVLAAEAGPDAAAQGLASPAGIPRNSGGQVTRP